VSAKLSECAPGVPLLSSAKLAFRVTSDVTVGLTPVALGRSKGFYVARSKREVMLNLELGHPRFCRWVRQIVGKVAMQLEACPTVG